MEKDGKDRKPAYLLLGLVGGSVLLALAVLLRPPASPRAPSSGHGGKPTRAWPDKDAPRLQDPAMIAQHSENSSVDMVERPIEAAKGQEVQPEAASAAPASARGPAAEADPVPPGLTPGEKEQFSGLAGGDLTDPGKAAEIGASNSGLWTKVMKGLSHYPRVMAYILNNDHVVKAFMSDAKNQKYCQSPAAAKGYLMDTKRPGGIAHAMQVFDVVAHGDKAMPGVVFGSKLADAMLNCPSGKALLTDKSSIGEIAAANPGLLHMMIDPTIMGGIGANARVSASLTAVQGSLTP